MKKIIIIILSVILALALTTGIILYALFRDEVRVIGTIRKISEDKNLYTMEYAGDYGYEQFLAEGGASSADEVAQYLTRFISKGFYKNTVETGETGCSTLAAASPSGGFLFGRNFDWTDCTCMIVKTVPVNGYRSLSTVNLDFLGYNADYQPDRFTNAILALGAPFAPLDGMNEKGLCVADLIIEDAGETHQDAGKPNLTTTTAIRMLLDNAATVEEAVALLGQYDMHSDAGTMHHLALADTTGRAVVIEYINNKMVVTDTPVVTNYFLSEGESYGYGSEASHERFAILQAIYDAGNGVLNQDQITAALMAVSQGRHFDPQWDTQWSVIFDQDAKKAVYYHHENYNVAYEVSLF